MARGRNILVFVSYRYGARRSGQRRGTGRGRSARLGGAPDGFRERLVDPVLQGRPFSSEDRRGRTTARGADGTSECPGDSSHERGWATQRQDPGDIQQADKCIPRAERWREPRSRPRSGQRLNTLSGPPLECRRETAFRICPLRWRAGPRRRLSSSVPHAPVSGKRRRKDRQASWAGKTRGDEARLRTSAGPCPAKLAGRGPRTFDI